MSTFEPREVQCHVCGTARRCALAVSIDADRKAAFREELIAGTFQRFCCGGCGTSLFWDGPFSWVDEVTGLYAWVEPAARRAHFRADVVDCVQRFEAYRTSAAARLAGRSMRARLVYGLGALREKIVIERARLDDTVIEALKAELLRARPDLQRAAPCLRVAWIGESIRFVVEGSAETIDAPLSLYDDVAASAAPLLVQLRATPFVDLQRVWRPMERRA